LGNDGRIRRPFIGAIQLHVPLYEAIDHLLQRGLVPPPTFPVQ
jgi:hypothetical protein